MADKFTAAESIRRLATMFQGMVEAADLLESMGKVEQATKEAEAAKIKAQEEVAAMTADAKKAKDELKGHKAKAEELIAKANDQALEKMREADQRAAAIVAGAEAEAKELVAKAERAASERTAAIAGQVAQLTTTKIELESSIASLTVAAGAKAKEVEDLEGKLSKIQAQIAKMLA